MNVLFRRLGVLLFLGLIVAGPWQARAEKLIDDFDAFVKRFDSKNCQECHEEIYNEWKKSWHSKSMVSSVKGIGNFFTVGVPDEWDRKLTKAEIMKCLDCHIPQIKFATERLALEIADLMIGAKKAASPAEKEKYLAKLRKLNITCYGCHNIVATRPSLGVLGEPEEGVIYTSNEVETDDHPTEKIPTLRRAVFCGQCHGVYAAPDGEKIMCNTLSGSYVHAYVGQGGKKTCQDCHMKKADRGHTMPGGHDLSIVKEGIDFSADIKCFRYGVGKWDPAVSVHVRLENRAGHRIPDG